MGKVKLNAEHRYAAELELPDGCDLPTVHEFGFYAGPESKGADGQRGQLAKDRRRALARSLKAAEYPEPRRIRATRITHLATGSVVSEKGQG